MPVDSDIDLNQGFYIGDKFYKIPEDIPTLEITTDEIKADMLHLDSMDCEFVIDITKNIVPTQGLTVSDLVLIIGLGFNPVKLKQNNWRRLHGLPLKRRKHHG